MLPLPHFSPRMQYLGLRASAYLLPQEVALELREYTLRPVQRDAEFLLFRGYCRDSGEAIAPTILVTIRFLRGYAGELFRSRRVRPPRPKSQHLSALVG